ncbi:MAG: hypothetical protein HYY60_03140 [Parcubacteria group bacterium]|nr:hypothetical protein [Parcubacteria group bacterium]
MFSKTKIITYLFLLAFTVITVAPIGFLYAADPPSYVPLAPLPPPPPDVVTQTGLAGYLQTLFWLAITLAGVLAVLMIVKGGVLYMTSEAFNTKQAAKTQITMAIVGFLLAISSVLILTTINPDLLKFKLLVRPLEFTAPPLAAGSIDGCTNLVSSPTNRCLWITSTFATCQDSFAISIGPLVRNDFRNGSDSDCTGTKPTDNGTKCCQWSAPQNGCSGAGRWAGKTQCAWSPDASGSDDCAIAIAATPPTLPAGLIKTGDEIFCSGTPPKNGIGAWKSDCCVK